jgi:four helix bundle protein
MNYNEWEKSVPVELTGDPLWKMEVYRLAVLASDLAWPDVSKLVQDERTRSLADQLYRAVGSVKANIAEGYSHRSGKDQARFYEYALGSAREARGWYYDARHALPNPLATHRMRFMTSIIKQLGAIIPSQRGYGIKEALVEYAINFDILNDIPQ